MTVLKNMPFIEMTLGNRHFMVIRHKKTLENKSFANIKTSAGSDQRFVKGNVHLEIQGQIQEFGKGGSDP